MRKNSREYFGFFLPSPITNYVFIFTHYNMNAIIVLIVMNNTKKELVMIAVH